MRLGFDATALTRQGKGVARFQREFLAAAAAHRLVDDLTVFVPEDPDEEALPQVLGWRYVRVPTRPMIVWEQLRLPLRARRLGLDAVITLSERAALWGPRQAVYIYEHPGRRRRNSREAGVGLRQRLVDDVTLVLFRLTIRRAAIVAAASRSTAADLAPLREAVVVYSGVSPEFSPGGGEPTYFLHLASDDPRDNSHVVVDAYAAYGGTGPLVIAGPLRAALPELRARAERHGITERVRWLGFQSDRALVDLYRGAIAYVDPSLYEGFGLQAAEALACGTPVIASNVTSLPEVVGDAGILIDPHDVAGFADAMRRLVEEPDLRAALAEKAVAQAARFTWERTARELLAAL